jgi:thioredoxin reductase
VAQLERPHPPGAYPVVVVGSGPGGLQVSYALSRLGVRHALLSQDDGPGGMFRRLPVLGRLVSWTKPFAPATHDDRRYERFDLNSLVGDEPAHRAIASEMLDSDTHFPTRDQMARAFATFAERAGIRVRYGCRWESTRRNADGFTVVTPDGEYRCRVVVFAIGMAQPWKPAIAGLDDVPHYAEFDRPREYSDRSVFIVGKRNSAFELADGLLPFARRIILGSPSPALFSVLTRSVVGARARYLQPYEDHVLAGGNFVIDVAIERVEKCSNGGFRVHATETVTTTRHVYTVDDVIAATGFEVPMQDLRSLGVATVMQDRLPAQTPFWESVSVPGIYFAGTVTQGATELMKHGVPSTSGAVQGFRYNARILARHIAEAHFGTRATRPQIAPGRIVEHLLAQATESPELWAQRAYHASVVELDPARGILDQGIVPLAHFIDASAPDAIAVAVEPDASGAIHPVVYTRSGHTVRETLLPSTQTNDFRTAEHRAELEHLLEAIRPHV